jgi:hypothetical protein
LEHPAAREQTKLRPELSLLHPASPAQPFSADPTADPAERQADAVGTQIAVDLTSTGAITPGRLPERVRAVAEDHLGIDLSGTELHTDTGAQAHADELGALAVTEGRHISFGKDQLSLSSSAGRAVLGHELTHVAQQTQHGVSSAQRIITTPEQIGLPTSDERRQGDAAMDRYLEQQKETEKTTAGVVGSFDAEAIKRMERAALVNDLKRLIRLRAIGIMGAHRAQIKFARDRILNETRQAPKADQKRSPGDQSKPPSALNDTRQAAKFLLDLRSEEGQFDSSKSSLQNANRMARRQGDMDDILDILTAPENMRHVPAKLMRAIGEGGVAAGRSGNALLWAIGSTYALLELRQKQIFGIQQAISRLHEAFPVLSVLNLELVNPERQREAVADPMSGAILEPSQKLGEAGDEELRKEIERGYAEIIAKTDNAIAAIAKEDISPFDMPLAMQAAAAGMKPEAFEVLKEEATRRQHEKFWVQLGLTLLEATLIFIPVVGPFLAGAAASVSLGVALSELNEMLAKRTVAEASTDPYSSPLGVEKVSSFEVAILAVGAILSAFEVGSVFRAIKGGKVTAEFGSLLDEVDALRKGGRADEIAETLSTAGRERRLAQSAERESVSLTDAEAKVELRDLADSNALQGEIGKRRGTVGRHEWVEEGPGKWCRNSDKKCIILTADIDESLLAKTIAPGKSRLANLIANENIPYQYRVGLQKQLDRVKQLEKEGRLAGVEVQTGKSGRVDIVTKNPRDVVEYKYWTETYTRESFSKLAAQLKKYQAIDLPVVLEFGTTKTSPVSRRFVEGRLQSELKKRGLSFELESIQQSKDVISVRVQLLKPE